MKELIKDITGKPLVAGIYARPEFGKTGLLIQMADLIAGEDGKVCFISLEMSSEQLLERCRRAGIDTAKFTICDTSVMEIIQFASEVKNVKVIAIDYLQLMEDKMPMKELSNLAHRLNIPVLITSQLSRAVEDNPEGRAMLKDIELVDEEYGKPDVAITIWRPHECERNIGSANAYDIKPYTELEILRSNCIHERIIPTVFDAAKLAFRFSEMED